jgi:hypothetical protein
MRTRPSNQHEPAAQRQITAVDAARGEFPVYIEIGIPYRISAGEWACPVALNGLHNQLHDMHGNDSFQALMLAQNLAKTLLYAFVEDGGRLLHAPGGAEIDVQRLFTSGI